MPTVKGSIDIKAPADRIWKWIAEPERYLIWNTDFTEYTLVDEKEGKIGTTYYMVGEKGGTPIKLDCTITEWVENQRLAFTGTAEWAEAEGVYTIEPKGDKCTVTFEETLELKGVTGKIISALFLKKAKKKNIEESLQSLKKALEDL